MLTAAFNGIYHQLLFSFHISALYVRRKHYYTGFFHKDLLLLLKL